MSLDMFPNAAVEHILANAEAAEIAQKPDEIAAGKTLALAELSDYEHSLEVVEHLNEYVEHERKLTLDVTAANVITSQIATGEHRFKHTIMLDLDVPARLVPSSTPGHSHLYIDVPVEWSDLAELLRVLAGMDVLEPGYVSVSLQRGYTALRLPWIKKAAEVAA